MQSETVCPGVQEPSSADTIPDQRKYAGYRRAHLFNSQEDRELTHIGPGTPCGEYMRRFWHPVALAEDFKDRPKHIRILAEDLVIYRDRQGTVGLLHEKCAHRGASLEYGVCEEKGLRCCYHGWLFDADGTILEIPGEPRDSKIVQRKQASVKQGAYPVREHKGIVFAYMGPSDSIPAFPVYDTLLYDDCEMQPYARDYPCNWLQITENALDPVHAVFLHVRATGPQFSDTWGQLSVKEFHNRETGLFYTNTRRVNDNVWVRLHEVILPNLTHAGAVMTMDGKTPKYFGRNTFTRWVVPVDNENSRVIAWANFGERTDPGKPAWKSEDGIDVIESGMPRNRSWEEARAAPSDYEAFISQGPIALHSAESLSGSDKGVAEYRRAIRNGIKAVASGETPFHPNQLNETAMPTYCGDTVLNIPRNNSPEEEQLLEVSRKVLEIIRSGDHLAGSERNEFVISQLKKLEKADES